MSPSNPLSTPLGREDFKALVDAVAQAVSERLSQPHPQLLDGVAARRYLGMSKSGWHRAKSAGLLPAAVFIEGSGSRWRKRDLDSWLERLKSRRRK
jgi:predicted DNA-binding transcriptional regulator AlpA